MKRAVAYLIILAALLAVPVKPLELDKLIPVQVISVTKEGQVYRIETDTENAGTGPTVEHALQNLKNTAKGIIYLDTAQYLLFTEPAQEAVETLRPELRSTVRLCLMETPVDLKDAAKFLDVQGKLPKLKHWKVGMEIPRIRPNGDSYIF